MARVLVAPQPSAAAGTALNYTAPTIDGDAVPPGCLLLVRNGSAAPINVTVVTGGKESGLDISDIGPVPVAAGADAVFGPFLPREVFAQPSGTEVGRVLVDYSAQASVTRAAVAL